MYGGKRHSIFYTLIQENRNNTPSSFLTAEEPVDLANLLVVLDTKSRKHGPALFVDDLSR